ncbi:MAG: hypothetical protein U5K51_07605 [Flavobacteriaceae bacterium]|nr:hypothetical protein [Flavobacteriaceae bacterium]
MYQLSDFLPTTKKELLIRGWENVDVIIISGDAYIDHPAFGTGVLGRILGELRSEGCHHSPTQCKG